MTSNANGNKSWKLLFYFGLAYFCQHFAQTGLMAQPMQFYFKEVLHFTEAATATFMASLVFPWMIKPLYGLISDYLPLFGYRRKSYLLILNLVAAGSFLYLTGVGTAETIRMALLLTAFCTAFSDVAVDGLMVELGKKTGQTANFQSMQWVWFNVAAIMSSLLGGYLINWFGATGAFHTACAITAAFPILVVVATWFWVSEEPSPSQGGCAAIVKSVLQYLGNAAAYFAKSLTSPALFFAMVIYCVTLPFVSVWTFMQRHKTLLTVAAFIFFWQFSPSFGTPFYYFQTDVLKFSQEFIGQLSAIGSIASVIGALSFNRLLAGRYSTKTLLYWSAVVGVIGTLAYLLMLNPATTGTPLTAIILGFVFGIAGQIAMLTTLTLAAENCPKRNEALTFALLMSLFNLSSQGSSITGAWLYGRATRGPGEGTWTAIEWLYQHSVAGFFSHFANALTPLIILSAVFTAVCLPLIRFLPNATTTDDDGGTNGNS